MKRWAMLLAAVFLLALLAGCSGADAEKLLRAPQYGGETGDVQKALNNFLGESIQLKFPTGGENLSPFLFGDWDGDGVEDAAVLYTAEGQTRNVYLAILERDAQNSWQVAALTEGLATEVEIVTIAAMQDSPANQILVGYGSEQTGQFLAVYSRSEAGLETVLQQDYSQMMLADLTGNGTQDLILVLPQGEDGGVELQVLVNMDGAFNLSQQLTVGAGVYSGCAGLNTGYGRDRMSYLVVDGFTGGTGSSLASTILIYDIPNRQLMVYRAPDVPDMYTATLRYNTSLLSMDLDGNGTVDIPRELSSEGLIDERIDRRVSFLEWFDYTGDNGGNRHFGVWDMEYNFFVQLPGEMQGSVRLRPTRDGWSVRGRENSDIYLDVRVVQPGQSIGDYFRAAYLGSQQIQFRLRSPYPGLDVQQLTQNITIF